MMRMPLARVEGLLLEAYAKVLWSRLVRRAERMRRANPDGGRVAVITHPFAPKRLAYFNRDGFREFRRRYRMRRTVKFGDMLSGAWYYTASRAGDDGLSADDVRARREVFVRRTAAAARR